MKFLLSLVLAAFALTGTAQASVIGGTLFQKVIHIAAGPTSTQSARNSGNDYSSPKGFYSGTLFEIPSNVIVTNVYAVVDTAVSGPTAINVGDTDTAAGFVASASSPLAIAGLNWWSVTNKGAYLKDGSVANAKYYGAVSGKNLTLAVTGTASAGKVRLVVTGFATGLPQ